jgi:hypothetical protein
MMDEGAELGILNQGNNTQGVTRERDLMRDYVTILVTDCPQERIIAF